VVGHDHLGPERRVDHAIVNRHGVVDDALDMKILRLWPRNVHSSPYHILDQNSTVLQNVVNLMDVDVPVAHVDET